MLGLVKIIYHAKETANSQQVEKREKIKTPNTDKI